jgi:ATP-dependent protease HslVU (ClpYQ) peptidase subunit
LPELGVHILVYKTADMLGLTSLKTHAAAKFLAHFNASTVWSDELALPLRALYENTGTDDKDLRYPTTMFLIANHQKVLAQKAVLKIVEEHEPILWGACSGLAIAAAKMLKATKEGAAKELENNKKIAAKELENTKNTAVAKLENLRADKEWVIATQGQILKTLQGKNLQCCHGKKIFFECDHTDNFKVTGIAHNCQPCFNS